MPIIGTGGIAPFVRRFLLIPGLPHQLQLVDKAGTFAPFVDDVKHVADIHADAALQFRLERDIAAHRLPIAIERETYHTGVLIEHGASGVATGDVVVGEETKLQLPFLVGVRTEIAVAHEV